MLGQADESLLTDSGAVGRFDKAGDIGANPRQFVGEDFTVVIASDDAETDRHSAQSGEIGRDGARSAAAVFGVRDSEHRDGGLGAYSQGVAVDIDIEHKVANEQDLGRAEVCYGFEQILVHLSPFLLLNFAGEDFNSQSIFNQGS